MRHCTGVGLGTASDYARQRRLANGRIVSEPQDAGAARAAGRGARFILLVGAAVVGLVLMAILVV